MVEIIGIDHIYIAVSDLTKSEVFYDKVFVKTLGFRKNQFKIDEDTHIQYYNKQFGFVLRPALANEKHNINAPGLHHFCLRVDSTDEVYLVVKQLHELGIKATAAKLYPEYASDYTATYFKDPDGIRLEVTNYRQERRDRHDKW